jgi:hypothetical protein
MIMSGVCKYHILVPALVHELFVLSRSGIVVRGTSVSEYLDAFRNGCSVLSSSRVSCKCLWRERD